LNHEPDDRELFLSWQGQVTGPHTLREVRNLLKLGKIHSLYKIQIEGQWILLRDHLATMDKEAREEAVRQAGRTAGLQAPSPPAVKPIVVPDNDWQSGGTAETDGDHLARENGSDPVPAGIATACFVLSLFFFVPFLNGITWLLALIFGHLALSNADERPRGKAATLAWIGLWITYVEIGFFLIGLAWFAVTEAMPMMAVYFLLHGQMLGNAIAALIGAGVLMLAVKLASGHLIRFSTCYVGALLPSAVSALGMFFLQASIAGASMTEGRNLLLIGLINLVLFVGQIFFWARFIRLPNDEELGLSKAVLTSMLYTAVFLFVGLGYAAILAVFIS
jgi:hypothetical protein